jgi:NADPH:quinone reductase-like Zn-dependent oxidoreductase
LALKVVGSVHEGFFINTNKSGTFQQYTIIDADLASKVRQGITCRVNTYQLQIPSNMSTEEAASLPLAIATAAISMYNGGGDLELSKPWTAEGKNKYAGKPFVVYGGSSSVGQAGE